MARTPPDTCTGTTTAGVLVYPHVFEAGIAKGFDRAKVVQVLAAAGMLKIQDTADNWPCKPHRVPSDIDPKETTTKRLYEFVSVTSPEDDSDSAPARTAYSGPQRPTGPRSTTTGPTGRARPTQ